MYSQGRANVRCLTWVCAAAFSHVDDGGGLAAPSLSSIVAELS